MKRGAILPVLALLIVPLASNVAAQVDRNGIRAILGTSMVRFQQAVIDGNPIQEIKIFSDIQLGVGYYLSRGQIGFESDIIFPISKSDKYRLGLNANFVFTIPFIGNPRYFILIGGGVAPSHYYSYEAYDDAGFPFAKSLSRDFAVLNVGAGMKLPFMASGRSIYRLEMRYQVFKMMGSTPPQDPELTYLYFLIGVAL
jgi:hypothetical protein